MKPSADYAEAALTSTNEFFNEQRDQIHKLNEQIEQLKKERDGYKKSLEFNYKRLKQENDKLRKERDEELKSFYRWVIFDNDSLPTNSTDLDNLVSEYKKNPRTMTPQDKAKPVWGGVTDSSSDEKYRIAAKWGDRVRQVSWVHLDKIHAGRTSKLAECTQNAMTDILSDYKEALREAVMKRFETGEPFSLLELLDTVLPKEK